MPDEIYLKRFPEKFVSGFDPAAVSFFSEISLSDFREKVIPGTGRAKHPGNDFLVDSRTCLPDASPLQG